MPQFTSALNWSAASHPQQMMSIISGGPPSHQGPTMSISPTQSNTAKGQRQMVSLPQMAPNLPMDHQREMQSIQQQHQESTYAQLKRGDHLPNFTKAMLNQGEASKMYQRNPQQMHVLQQQQQHYHQMQREKEASMMFQHHQSIDEKREFKTPDNIRYERQDMGRSSVGSIENEYISNLGGRSDMSQSQRSTSSLSQPDYTQVSPAKLALRRHLSQEKLTQHPNLGPQLMTKTVGEFINSEIEKTLEITPQSIINAVIQHNLPNSGHMSNDSMMMDRDVDHHHPHSNMKPSSSKSQQQHYMHQGYPESRSKGMPMTSKYAPEQGRRMASPNRFDEAINFTSRSKSPPRHYQQSESSYKIEPKVFTSNIGSSMRKEDIKEKLAEPPLEGLAASLRQHVIASMKIKEETEMVEPKYNYQPMPFQHVVKKEGEIL